MRSSLTNQLKSNSLKIYYGQISDLIKYVTFEVLSGEEKKRADQILLQNDRDLFIISRVFLRKLLSFFLNIEAHAIQIEYNTNGKPYINSSCNLKFSISHSKNIILFGFIENSEIGVDIEYLKRKIAIDKVSEFLFSTNELIVFKNTKEELQQEKFIDHWTRKEAILKAKGSGLSIVMNEFEIPFYKIQELVDTCSTTWLENEKYEWFLKSFNIPYDYRASVAVRGPVDSFELININEIGHTL